MEVLSNIFKRQGAIASIFLSLSLSFCTVSGLIMISEEGWLYEKYVFQSFVIWFDP